MGVEQAKEGVNKYEGFKKSLKESFKSVPRPNEINFPECQNKLKYSIKRINTYNENLAERGGGQGRNIFLLQSGNILIAFDELDPINLNIKSTLEILTFPDLKKVQNYSFPGEKGNILYGINNAIQLKNGNIFVVREKFYEFDGENIEEGPKRSSVKFGGFNITSVKFIQKKKTIEKDYGINVCEQLMEAIEGKLLYTSGGSASSIDCIDSTNFEDSCILDGVRKHFDLIFRSEINPEQLFICENEDYGNKSSRLLVYDIQKFCNKKDIKNPLFTMKISNSENVYGYCEYDEHYLLLDTILKGIYIFDMKTKTKAAVCNLTRSKVMTNIRFRRYGKMYKLADGQIIRMYYDLCFVDIRESQEVNTGYNVSLCHFKKDNYIACLYLTSGSMEIVEVYNQ